MSVSIFHSKREHWTPTPGERWEPATEQQVRHYDHVSMEDEPGWSVSHEGRVVARREANWYDDSDFYAVYYDPETDSFKETQYGTTRFWAYGNTADIDAPATLIEDYWARQRVIQQAYYEEEQAAWEAAEAATPRVGKVVKATRAFKVKGVTYPKDSEWEVFWYGESSYGYKRTFRVGLRSTTSETTVFTSSSNVEVVPGMTMATSQGGGGTR